MNTRLVALIALTGIIIVAAIVLVVVPAPTSTNTPPPAATTTTNATPPGIPDLISVTAPMQNQTISSPITITGTARGTWYFEASFPIEIRDSQGNSIGQGPGQAQGDWMTTDFVPFSASITFTPQPVGSKGTIVVKNDNPSGDPARDKSVEIPILF